MEDSNKELWRYNGEDIYELEPRRDAIEDLYDFYYSFAELMDFDETKPEEYNERLKEGTNLFLEQIVQAIICIMDMNDGILTEDQEEDAMEFVLILHSLLSKTVDHFERDEMYQFWLTPFKRYLLTLAIDRT